MKRLLLFLSFYFVIQSAQSQVLISLLLGETLNSGKVEFGLDGGVNFPTIRGLSEGEMHSNFNIGFYFDIKMKNTKWMYHTGVMVKASLGTYGLPVYSLNDAALDSSFAGGQIRRKINYFSVPFMMKYKFNNNFFAEGGIMPSLRHKSYDLFMSSVDGNDLEYKKDIRDELHQIDFGLIGGLGYRLMGGNGMNLGVRYYYGLTDITIDDSTPDQFNESLYLYVGIPIGAGKAKEREAQ